MTIVDNSEQLRDIIFKGLNVPGNFYSFIIMQRKKDGHPNTVILKRMKIDNMKNYDENVEIMKKYSVENNARCYMKVNVRNEVKISEELVKYVVSKHFEKNYHMMMHAYDHIVGVTNCAGKDSLYHIDIDDIADEPKVLECLRCLHSKKQIKDDYTIIRVPTLTGVHLLVSPFNTEFFTKTLPHIIIQKDGETLFYYK